MLSAHAEAGRNIKSVAVADFYALLIKGKATGGYPIA